MEYLYPLICILIIIIGYVTFLIFTQIYRSRLKKLAPEVYISLYPGFMRKNLGHDHRAFMYVVRGGFRNLPHPELVRFCERYRIFTIAYWILTAVCAILLVLTMPMRGRG